MPGAEMTDTEIATFLAANDVGVLSLSGESRGYGVPISFSYDEKRGRLLLGFVAPAGSTKLELATATETATLTVYTYEDVDAWQSVVVTGTIRPVESDDDTLRVPNLFFSRESDDDEDGRVVDLDTFERTWYELGIETLSGRYSGK